MKKRKETRIEIIEGSERRYNKYDCIIEEDIQDNGRTLKLFIYNGKKTVQGFREALKENGLLGTKF